MALTINSQDAFRTYNLLKKQQSELSKTQLRLATSKRINSVADDTSGYNVGKSLESKMAVQNAQLNNAEAAKDYLSTAESALTQVYDLLNDVTAKSIDADDPTKNKDNLAADIKALSEEIDSILKNTKVSGHNILANDDGSELAKNGKFDIGTGDFTVDFAGEDFLKVDILQQAIHGSGSSDSGIYKGKTIENAIGPSSPVIYSEGTFGDPTTQPIEISFSDGSVATVNVSIAVNDTLQTLSNSVFDALILEPTLADISQSVVYDECTFELKAADPDLTITKVYSPGPIDVAGLVGLDENTNGGTGNGLLSDDTDVVLENAKHMDVLLDNVGNSLGRIGNLKQISEVQSDYLTSSINNMTSTVSKLFDADMVEEQVNATKQAIASQLGTTVLKQLSIAPQQLLTLFQ